VNLQVAPRVATPIPPFFFAQLSLAPKLHAQLPIFLVATSSLQRMRSAAQLAKSPSQKVSPHT
jgi:hypothetical protein